MIYVCNTYFSPLPCDTDENEQTLVALLRAIAHIRKSSPGAWILVGGDFNYDPFKSKGSNKGAYTALTSICQSDCSATQERCTCALKCVPRPNGRSYSRPESRAHMDNFLVN